LTAIMHSPPSALRTTAVATNEHKDIKISLCT